MQLLQPIPADSRRLKEAQAAGYAYGALVDSSNAYMRGRGGVGGVGSVRLDSRDPSLQCDSRARTGPPMLGTCQLYCRKQEMGRDGVAIIEGWASRTRDRVTLICRIRRSLICSKEGDRASITPSACCGCQVAVVQASPQRKISCGAMSIHWTCLRLCRANVRLIATHPGFSDSNARLAGPGNRGDCSCAYATDGTAV